jgi:hypothetical protein
VGRAAAQHQLVVAVLVTVQDRVATLGGWRVVDAEGNPVVEGLFPARDLDHLRAVIENDQSLTIADLLRAGRDYVEPTPTPFPEGIPTIDPNLVGPD